MTSEGETYDFIVTGAGSAGCVVAARLSESGRHRVLLLEAGPPDSNPWIHIPLGFAKTYVNPQVNWKFETEPQPQLANRRLYLPRGKTLGGSQFDQRHGLHARQPRRLRRMAPARLRRLGLGFRPAVLQEGREPDARRRRIPRRRRPAARLRPARPLRTGRRGAGGRRAGRHPAQSRLQRRAAGRLRLLPDHQQQPAAAGARRRPICNRRARGPTW